jgi:hypothetical protein
MAHPPGSRYVCSDCAALSPWLLDSYAVARWRIGHRCRPDGRASVTIAVAQLSAGRPDPMAAAHRQELAAALMVKRGRRTR